MVELGDVSPDDVMLLQGRGAQELERAVTDAKLRLSSFKRSPDVRTVLVFFIALSNDLHSRTPG